MTGTASVRKTQLFTETVLTDDLGRASAPITRCVSVAVVSNPLAGQAAVDLSVLFEIGAEIGEALAPQAVAALSGAAVSYGKAALVGVAGEMEHGGAVVHPRLGTPMRAAVGGGRALIPANVKVAAPGVIIDIPLGHKDDPWSFDHIDTITLSVGDAPRPDEIVIFIAVADGGRPTPRCGRGPSAGAAT